LRPRVASYFRFLPPVFQVFLRKIASFRRCACPHNWTTEAEFLSAREANIRYALASLAKDAASPDRAQTFGQALAFSSAVHTDSAPLKALAFLAFQVDHVWRRNPPLACNAFDPLPAVDEPE
jgi:hypothetical protein